MPPRLAAVAALGALLAAGSAVAAPGDDPVFRTERHVSEFAPDALPTPFSPYHSVRTEALPGRALHFFGEGDGYALGSGVSMIELEGGAALRVYESLSLTASYRLIDVRLGAEAAYSGVGSHTDFAAPYLGFRLDF